MLVGLTVPEAGSSYGQSAQRWRSGSEGAARSLLKDATWLQRLRDELENNTASAVVSDTPDLSLATDRRLKRTVSMQRPFMHS